MRYLLALTLVACSGAPEPTESDRSSLASCGADGHVLPNAAIGDTYTACDDRVQSVVISGGEVSGIDDGACWSLTVVRLTGGAPLVIQLRDVEHRTVCVGLQ